jgi:hypothetical protein
MKADSARAAAADSFHNRFGQRTVATVDERFGDVGLLSPTDIA